MKRTTIENRRSKIGTYAIRKSEQLHGQFRSTSPFNLVDSGNYTSFEEFKKRKRGGK